MDNLLETSKIDGIAVNQTTVILRAKSGESLEGGDAKKIIELIEQKLPGDYFLVIDRINDYSVSPVGVYKYLNSRERLKGIGIVTYRSISNSVSTVEKSLCEKPLQVFASLATALDWACGQFPNTAEPGDIKSFKA